ncbi:DUF929 family protein [Cutibacterium porci]|uniref:DUF929 family protein n=1 Tax=Cutibacterium porci TaxID=2605781 RepID=UPI0012B223D5|nr:DUF929 family protein [Cutibacterium porci]
MRESEKGVMSAGLVSLDPSLYDKIGKGQAQYVAEDTGNPIGGSGQASLLYVGAEFCPYCAMERLSLTAALSRFGKFDGLSDSVSSSREKDMASIPTVTYRNSTYSSKYVRFSPVELQDSDGNKISDLTSEQRKVFQKYDPKGYIPFLYWGDSVTEIPAQIQSLSNKTSSDAMGLIKNPDTDESKKVIGGANLMSAEICKRNGGRPASVCTSKGVRDADSLLR